MSHSFSVTLADASACLVCWCLQPPCSRLCPSVATGLPSMHIKRQQTCMLHVQVKGILHPLTSSKAHSMGSLHCGVATQTRKKTSWQGFLRSLLDRSHLLDATPRTLNGVRVSSLFRCKLLRMIDLFMHTVKARKEWDNVACLRMIDPGAMWALMMGMSVAPLLSGTATAKTLLSGVNSTPPNAQQPSTL